MLIKERHEVIIEKHPHYESLNKKLMEDIRKFEFFPPERLENYTNIQGTQYNPTEKEWTPTMGLILDWVYRLVNDQVSKGAHEFYGEKKCNMWFAKYNKGDYCKEHWHYPWALMGFVYFVKCPKGSSPLVFPTSGKKVKAEEGKVVIFAGNIFHSVPPNKCEDRIVMAGNLGYDLNT